MIQTLLSTHPVRFCVCDDTRQNEQKNNTVSQPNHELMVMEQTDLKPLQDVEECESIRCQVTRRLVKWRKDASLWPRVRLLGILSHATDVGPSPKVSLRSA
jgi:hypothetical protein